MLDQPITTRNPGPGTFDYRRRTPEPCYDV